MSNKLTLNKTALTFVSNVSIVSKEKVSSLTLDVIAIYKNRYKEEKISVEESVGDKKLLVNRVQNAIVLQVSKEIRNQYEGEFYIWLPSDAENPDPEHQLNYGKKFQIGVGEMPGERFGCRCGMQILVKEDTLSI